MVPDLKLFIVAGEPSGDRLGAALISGLKAKSNLSLRGVGGHAMADEGLQSLFDMSDLSVMGFVDVFFALPRVLRRLGEVVRAALAYSPDAVVLIDNQVFSQMVAARLRRAGYSGRIYLYVAPSVWAWKPDRARKIAPIYDEVFAVLPFEPRSMSQLGGPPTSYVGHPAESLITSVPQDRSRGLVALLPGSRAGELRRHLPVFREIASQLQSHNAVDGFVIPTLPHLRERIEQEVSSWTVAVEVVTGADARRQAFEQSIVALAGAGTVTLELALMDVPMVGTYVPDWFQMRAYKRWGRPLVLLPNIVLSRALVPEIEPGQGHAARVVEAVRHLLDSKDARAAQRAGFAELKRQFVDGLPEIGRADAAERILSTVRRT